MSGAETASDGAGRWTASPEQLAELLTRSPIGLAVVAAEGALLEVNPALCDLLGRDEDYLLSRSWQELTHHDMPGRELELIQDVLAGRRDLFRTETAYQRPDGSEVWVDLSVSAVRTDGGAIAYAIAQLVDVTEATVMRQALEEERSRAEAGEELLRVSMDAVLDPLVLLQAERDPLTGVVVDLRYLDANRATCEYFSMSREDLIGRGILEMAPGQRDTGLFALYVAAVEEDQPTVVDGFRYENEIISLTRYYDIRACRVSHDRLSVTWRDVTERRENANRLAESEAFQRLLIQSLVEPWVLLNAVRDDDDRVTDFRFADANEVALRVYGMAHEELMGRLLSVLHPAAWTTDLFDMYVAVVDENKPMILDDWSYPQDIYDGEVLRYDVRAVKVGDSVSQTWRDVSERHVAQKQLAQSEELYRLLAENASDVIIRSSDGVVRWVSPSLTATFGWEPADWIGRDFLGFAHPDDLDLVQRGRSDVDHGSSPIVTFRLRSKDGTFHWVEAHAGPYRDPHGNPGGILAALRIVDAEVEAKEELERLAHFDTLTGLLNRKEILRKLSGISAGARRPGQFTAVLFCDIDHFKDINDTHGHAAGDEVLRTLAERIGATVRDEDYVARIGGDELLVILTSVHGLEDATAVAEKIREVAAGSIGLDRARVATTLSIGVTLVRPGEGVDSLVARADEAMYEAKSLGRNRVIPLT